MSYREFSGYQTYVDRRRLPAGTIYWTEAKDHIDETVSIYGEVKSTYFDWEDYERFVSAYAMGADPTPTFIEVGEKYPSMKLVKIVIWGRDRKLFKSAPDLLYKDQTIIFTGRPYRYDGITTVQISSPDAIRVVEPIKGLLRHDGADISEREDPNRIVIDDGYIDIEDDVPPAWESPLYGWHFDEDNGWLDYDPED